MEKTPADISKYDSGSIGIYYLVKIWQYFQGLRNNHNDLEVIKWKYINGVFNALGVGTEPTIKYLMNSNRTLEKFENWLFENGNISKMMIEQFNFLIDNEDQIDFEPEEKVFSKEDLNNWENQGYVILKNAVSKEDCEHTVDFILDQLGADLSDPDTWYKPHPLKQGIMVQLFNAETLDKNRFSKRIKLAYHQLWKRGDLMVSMDRVSFNPPENEHYQFQGPNLHWDMSLKKPIYFGLQGLLYLTDTDENQGAFTLIPGFHKIIDTWLDNLPSNQHPREVNLWHDFEPKPIAAKAGDFIIWNQSLPHGSSPNTSNKPRIVQYINYQPLNMEYQSEWI